MTATTDQQQRLDIEVEKFTAKEEGLRRLLRQYPLMDEKISHFQSLANGDGLIHEPSVTMRPPDDDDVWIIAQRVMEPLTEQQQKICDTIARHVSSKDITYATCGRVAKRLSSLRVEDSDEQTIIEYALKLLQDAASGADRLELTETERLAILREPEIQNAKQKLQTWQEKKYYTEKGLRILKTHKPYEYELLWNRYVLNKRVADVCDIIGLNFTTQLETYKVHRRKAMREFAEWIPRHILN